MKKLPNPSIKERAEYVACVRLAMALEQIEIVRNLPNATKHPKAEQIVRSLTKWYDKCMENVDGPRKKRG